MLMTRAIHNLAIFAFAIITYVNAVPIQIPDETLDLNGIPYAQPELAEAIARSYTALEWAQRCQEPRKTNIVEMTSRNLDHIGGGLLLRELHKRELYNPSRHLLNSLADGMIIGR